MSSQAVRAFLPALKELERRLTVPIPDRLRILRELEYDLEELRARFEARGMPAEEARARALEALVPHGAAVRDLDWVHAPLYARLTSRMGERRLRLLERSALVLATATVLTAAGWVVMGLDLTVDPSPFLWPVLGLGGVLFAAMVAKAFQLWIKRDHTTPDRGVGGILALSGVVLGSGVVGVVMDLYLLATELELHPELAGRMAYQWLVRDCALLSVAILLALAGGLFWFVVTRWLTELVGARHDLLGMGAETTSRKENR